MNEKQARERSRTMVRAQLSTQDMWDASRFSSELVELPVDPGDEHWAAHRAAVREEFATWRHRAALLAAVVAYSRPFMWSDGGGVAASRLRVEDLPDVHPHHQELHARLLRIRHDILAHAAYDPRQLKQAQLVHRDGAKGEYAYTSKNYWAELDALTLREVNDQADYMFHVFGRLAGEIADELRDAGFPPAPETPLQEHPG